MEGWFFPGLRKGNPRRYRPDAMARMGGCDRWKTGEAIISYQCKVTFLNCVFPKSVIVDHPEVDKDDMEDGSDLS
jgi:hypothetical protein